MKIIGIIPARYGSTRFPGKPLADIRGKTMVQHVYERAMNAGLDEVMVATDDQRIFSQVSSFGGNVVMTSAKHASGTDRCLEALQKSKFKSEAVINIQGDEPFIHPEQIQQVAALLSKPEVQIATLAIAINSSSTLHDPNKVKVMTDVEGRAIYFSRNVVPFQKNIPPEKWHEKFGYLKHLGVYGYKTDVLEKICSLKPSPLELAESLEQLRWLENGFAIHVLETQYESMAIDTPEDLEKLLASLS